MSDSAPQRIRAVRVKAFNQPYEVADIDVPYNLEAQDIVAQSNLLATLTPISKCYKAYTMKNGAKASEAGISVGSKSPRQFHGTKQHRCSSRVKQSMAYLEVAADPKGRSLDSYKVVAIENRQEAIDLAHAMLDKFTYDQNHVVYYESESKKIVETLMGSFHDTDPSVDRVIFNARTSHLVKFAQQFTHKGGVIVDVGLPSDSIFEVNPFAVNFKEQTIKGGLIWSVRT
ncbi:hypothetical protein Q7P37_006058 [Cladosporium fusiforme]